MVTQNSVGRQRPGSSWLVAHYVLISFLELSEKPYTIRPAIEKKHRLSPTGEKQMVKTASTMLPLGTKAPDFSLPNIDGRTVSLSDFANAPGLLVIAMCNHCPFVIHLRSELARFAREYQQRGLAIVGISSNDVSTHPDDGPEKMVVEAQSAGYTFPYLYDETQDVAKAYRAACTPDFFLFDKDQKLVYRGQFDDSRPGNGLPITGADLRAACDAVLADEPVPEKQRPSIGCNIKWKEGNAPDYFTGIAAE
jgi:peroxiredoxin